MDLDFLSGKKRNLLDFLAMQQQAQQQQQAPMMQQSQQQQPQQQSPPMPAGQSPFQMSGVQPAYAGMNMLNLVPGRSTYLPGTDEQGQPTESPGRADAEPRLEAYHNGHATPYAQFHQELSGAMNQNDPTGNDYATIRDALLGKSQPKREYAGIPAKELHKRLLFELSNPIRLPTRVRKVHARDRFGNEFTVDPDVRPLLAMAEQQQHRVQALSGLLGLTTNEQSQEATGKQSMLEHLSRMYSQERETNQRGQSSVMDNLTRMNLGQQEIAARNAENSPERLRLAIAMKLAEAGHPQATRFLQQQMMGGMGQGQRQGQPQAAGETGGEQPGFSETSADDQFQEQSPILQKLGVLGTNHATALSRIGSTFADNPNGNLDDQTAGEIRNWYQSRLREDPNFIPTANNGGMGNKFGIVRRILGFNEHPGQEGATGHGMSDHEFLLHNILKGGTAKSIREAMKKRRENFHRHKLKALEQMGKEPFVPMS